MNEKEFEEYFNQPDLQDPEEYKARDEALRESEEEIKKTNDAYKKGEKTWFDKVNEFSDLPQEEFEKEKTGADIIEGRGLLKPLPNEIYDEESERYFQSIRNNRITPPTSYNAVSLGK